MELKNFLTVLLLVVHYFTVDAIPQDERKLTKPERCYGTEEVMGAKCCLFPPFFVREIARACGAIFALKYRSFDNNITTFRREAMTVRTLKEEAKALAIFAKYLYEKAIRGVKNRTIPKKNVITINTYKTKKRRGRKRKKKHTITQRHVSTKSLQNPENLTFPQNQTSLRNHMLSPNHQPSLNQNKSSHTKSSDESWTCILRKYHLLKDDDTLDMELYHTHLDNWVELNPAFYKVIHEAKSKCKYRFQMYLPLKAEEYFTFQTCIRTYINMHCPQMVKSELCEEQKIFYEKCSEYLFK